MIEEPPRRGDHHIGAAVDLQRLRLEGDAADEQGDAQIVKLAQGLEGFLQPGRQVRAWARE